MDELAIAVSISLAESINPMNLDDFEKHLQYEQIFEDRGYLYHQAMTGYPESRDLEFKNLFSWVPLRPFENLLDVPSGGGYLSDYVVRNFGNYSVSVRNLEFTNGFSEKAQVVSPDKPWGFAGNGFDRVVCLAAAHHIFDLSGLLRNCINVLRPGGLLHVADVPPGSGVENFLENFVHRFTPGGHRGLYRNLLTEDWPVELRLLHSGRMKCPWTFHGKLELLEFSNDLFGLVDAPRLDLEQALGEMIGIHESESGVRLLWELDYIVLQKVPLKQA